MSRPQRFKSFHDIPILIRADELATLLRTSTRAIYAMTERGQLPGVVRVGRRLLYRREAVLRWLGESRASSQKERRT